VRGVGCGVIRSVPKVRPEVVNIEIDGNKVEINRNGIYINDYNE
jgi:hypothetical protein